MNYVIYKMKFLTAVHFGNGRLEDSGYTFGADTLFSALYIEALKEGEKVAQTLYELSKAGKILFSNAFPYMDKSLLLPKPVCHIKGDDNTGNSVVKKAFKNLKYIPSEELNAFLQGKYDVLNAPAMDLLGVADLKAGVSIRGNEETEPYRTGTYRFARNNGLYFILGYEEDEDMCFIDDLLDSLSYSGIGGRRFSGMGRFTIKSEQVPESLLGRLNDNSGKQMCLTFALPREDELESVMADAEYVVSKRSGFVASAEYADEYQRKRNLFVFNPGSCFNRRFQGDIYDVSSSAGKHPVYRYAKPLFVGVDS